MYTFAEADARAPEIPKGLQATEFEDHDSKDTRMLAGYLFCLALNHVPENGRILLVGPNPFLCYCLLEQGYEIEVWTYGQRSFVESLSSYVRVDIGPDELAALKFPATDAPYDLIVLPLILETLACDLRPVLRALRDRLAPGGGLAVATTNLFKLGIRWRACLGRDFLPLPFQSEPLHSGGWRGAPVRHYGSLQELGVYAEKTGFSLRDIAYTMGYCPLNDQEQLDPGDRVKRKVAYWSQRVLPSFRDYVVMFWETEMKQDLPPLPDQPMVSVIVPSYNRRELLGDLLETLFAQTYPRDRYEIIIVDNSSSDGTEEAVVQWQAAAPCPLRFYRKENEGPAVSRNYGAEGARGHVLAFIDSDCLAEPGWIKQAVRHFVGGVAMVAGSIIPVDNLHKPVGFFRHSLPPLVSESALYPTANIFYRKDVFDNLGGFDDRFKAFPWGTPVGGEDVDLAWRLRGAGYTYQFDPAVQVRHQTSPLPVREWLLEGVRPGVIPLLVVRHPALRRELLFRRVFLDQAEAMFCLGLAGTALVALVGPLGLLLWLPWLIEMRGHCRNDWSRTHRWPIVAVKYGFLFLMFLIQAVSLWWTSLRYRAVVL